MIFELSRRMDGQDLYLLTHPLIEGHKNPAFNVIMHKSVEILREKDFANSAILYMMAHTFFYITEQTKVSEKIFYILKMI